MTGEIERKATKETMGVVCHKRPEAGVDSVQPAVFSKKASEPQCLAMRAMRSFHNRHFDRITNAHAGRGSHGATESAESGKERDEEIERLKDQKTKAEA